MKTRQNQTSRADQNLLNAWASSPEAESSGLGVAAERRATRAIRGWNLSENVSAPGSTSFDLTYSDESSHAVGRIEATPDAAGTYAAIGGVLEVTSGPLTGTYSLIAQPYAPGVDYNRVLVSRRGGESKFHLDGNGMLFEGAGFQLNLWSDGRGHYNFYRSDGRSGKGKATLAPVGLPGAQTRSSARRSGARAGL